MLLYENSEHYSLSEFEIDSSDLDDFQDALEDEGYVVYAPGWKGDAADSDAGILQLVADYIMRNKTFSQKIYSKDDLKKYLDEIVEDNYNAIFKTLFR